VNLLERYQGCLVGLACGDAIGAPIEFKRPGTFTPIKDIATGGKFSMRAGEWTDDTAMALCLAQSLIDSSGFDALDQMKKYRRWVDTGYFSTRDSAFGVGQTVLQALIKFSRDGSPYAGSTKPTTAGNGALMRLAPVLMYYYPEQSLMTKYSIKSAQVTHGAAECLQANQLFSQIIFRALNNGDKESILFDEFLVDAPSEGIQAICDGSYRSGEVQGTGYVVDSLAAALWCFYSTDTYKDAVLKAANLGDDADTTAAICGQVAGAYYGIKSIPNHWLEYLYMYDEIINISNKIYYLAYPKL